MKFKTLFTTVSLLILALTISCKSNDCFKSDPAYVTSVESPTIGKVNKTTSIEVDFQVHNGCGSFRKFIETKDNNISHIEIEAKYVGCMCTQDIPTRTVAYKFTPKNAGNYELNFKSSSAEYITVNLTID